MNADEIRALQKVSDRYDRQCMFKMLFDFEDMINEEQDKMLEKEAESEDDFFQNVAMYY